MNLKHLAKYKHIVVTGPQRSGTRFVAKAIAHDTGHRYIDEKDIHTEHHRMAVSALSHDNVVLQCPALSHVCHEMADDDTLVVMVHRPVDEILASQKRIGWDKEDYERKKYPDDHDSQSSATAKYHAWIDWQRDKIKHAQDINYYDLDTHALWLPPDKRDTLGWDGTTPQTGPRIVGTIALCNFPLWEQSVRALLDVVDELYIRFDGVNGDPEILRQLGKVCGKKLKNVAIVGAPWRPPQWREDMVRMLDEVKPSPDIVLCPDEDEIFGDGLRDELDAFWASDKRGMMFGYEPLVTDDGREINGGTPYPPKPHMKAYKWEPSLCYYPWHKEARLARYMAPREWFNAKTLIRHYCCFTKGLEKLKHWRSDTPRAPAKKAVTLIGFGPTAREAKLDIAGEIWTLNNCYDVFDGVGFMKMVTRIFEMHLPAKRKYTQAKDGKPHYWHLNRLGRMGHRIVMQDALREIQNSEAYPLVEAEALLGWRMWAGTVPYMVAMAILERYTHIRVFGFDQMDWEHTVQRQAFMQWIGVARGRGISVDGALTFRAFHQRRYGYDYGPEWDAECNRLLWLGHPVEIKYKEQTRAMLGDMAPKVGG